MLASIRQHVLATKPAPAPIPSARVSLTANSRVQPTSGDTLVGGGKSIGSSALAIGAMRGLVMFASAPAVFLCRIKASDGVLMTVAADAGRLGEPHALPLASGWSSPQGEATPPMRPNPHRSAEGQRELKPQ
jgi:hypothetical protein